MLIPRWDHDCVGNVIKGQGMLLKGDVSVVFCQFYLLTHMDCGVLGCEPSVDVIIPQP